MRWYGGAQRQGSRAVWSRGWGHRWVYERVYGRYKAIFEIIDRAARFCKPLHTAAEEEFIEYLGKTNHFAAVFTHFASHTSRQRSHLSVFRYVRV